MARKSKARQPLKISVHGAGVDVEASFSDRALVDVLADAIARATTAVPPSTATPEHDFDLMQRLITHADPHILEAFIQLAQVELEKRRSAS